MKTTKQEIIDISIDLFAKYGVQNVSIDKIASKSKIATGTIYYHFKGGKDEIVDNIVMIFDDMIRYNPKLPNI